MGTYSSTKCRRTTVTSGGEWWLPDNRILINRKALVTIKFWKFGSSEEHITTVLPYKYYSNERLHAQGGKHTFSLRAGMAQWWEHSPPTNVSRVRFPDSASYVGWDCWLSTLHRDVFSGYSGFPSPQKTNIWLDLLSLFISVYSVPN